MKFKNKKVITPNITKTNNNYNEDIGWINWNSKIKEKKLTPTLKNTYDLFIKGYKIPEISLKRNFKEETTQKQIIELIKKSMINIDDVIEKKKRKEILKIIEEKIIYKLSEIKSLLPTEISWFEIKCILAYINSFPTKQK